MARGGWLLILALACCPQAGAHPADDWASQHRALTDWAERVEAGTATGDAATQPATGGILTAHDITQVMTRFATFTPGATEGSVTVSPVVLFADQGTFRFAVSVELEKTDDHWQVTGLTPGAELPPALVTPDLPEHAVTAPVAFVLTDENGDPAHARVRITDASGRYWPPNGHQKHIRLGWRQDVGGDVSVGGQTFAYVRPEFAARLPAGDFTLEVRKGTEFLPARHTFSVGEDSTTPIEVQLERWIDMNARGWYSGDTHTHFLDDHTGMLEMLAEDLNVLYVLATKWGELITDVERFTGTPSSF